VGSNSFYDDDLKDLMALIQAGKMKPVIDKVLPLEEARQGLRLIRDPRGHGNKWLSLPDEAVTMWRAGRPELKRPLRRPFEAGFAGHLRMTVVFHQIESMLEIIALTKTFGEDTGQPTLVLDAVSFAVARNQFVCLLGGQRATL